MRQWTIAAGAAAIGVAIGVSLGTVAWPIDPGRVQRDFAFALGRLDAPHRATFTLLPRPTLRIEGLKTEGGAIAVAAGGAEATLRLGRLLLGEFSPQALTLRGAEIRIDAAAAKAGLKRLEAPSLSRLNLQNASVDVVAGDSAATTHFDIASARIDWSSAAGPLRAQATGRWRLQPVDATLELDSPLAAAHGEPSVVRASLDAPLGQLRVAGDWSPSGTADGALYRGDPTSKANRLTYGLPIFAPASGIVVDSVSDVPENSFAANGDAQIPSSTEAIDPLGFGNHVTILHTDGRVSWLLHMQPGSVAVAPGEHVRAGQFLGKVGFSGDSLFPHLHFNVTEGSRYPSQGVPSYFKHFVRVVGSRNLVVSFGEVDTGDLVQTEGDCK